MKRARLLAIYDDVERRAKATNEAFPSWPCRRGCDHCCRHLAEVPRITRQEWLLLREGIARLDEEVRADVEAKLASSNHRVCPLLDEDEGACRVYAERPGACRTYGYYVERADILGCDLVVGSAPPDAVWGNELGVRQALATLSGEPLPLTEWSSSLPLEGGAGRSPSPSSSI